MIDPSKPTDEQKIPPTPGDGSNNATPNNIPQPSTQASTPETEPNKSEPSRAEIENPVVSETESNKVIARWTRRLGIFTFVLSVCAIAGIVFTILQMIDSNKNTNTTFVKMQNAINELRVMAKADSISAETNKKLALISDSAFYITNRAFIAFENISNFEIQNRTINFSTVIGNLGHTPAYVYGFQQISKFTDSTGFSKFIKTFNIHKILDSTLEEKFPMVIGENMVQQLNGSLKITGQEFIELNEKKIKWYMIGVIYYRDFFKKIHHTCFSGVYDVATQKFGLIGKYNYDVD